MPRTGVTMACSQFHVKGHNKRDCYMLRTGRDGATPILITILVSLTYYISCMKQ